MATPTASAHPPLTEGGGRVIRARRMRTSRDRYDVVLDDAPIATWEKSLWGPGGTIVVDGHRHQVRVNLIEGTAHLTRAGGARVATASGIGRKNWTIEADGTTHHFRRAAPWRREQRLHEAGHTLGWIRPTGLGRGDAVGDLPGMPLTTQVFALALALTTWEAEAAATG